ncbi:Subtilisin-like serine protease pepC [Termitomyces sp. T112]|nr:Subtilisin-like serine protease pepC [Termitomyces sp. T112]
MRSMTPFLAAITIILLVFPSPGLSACQIQSSKGKTTGRHIVKLKPNVKMSTFLKSANVNTTFQWEDLHAFGGEMTQSQIAALCNNDDVRSISEDGVFETSASTYTVQKDARWNLARLTASHNLAADKRFPPYYYQPSAVAGVDIYILDTGVYLEHNDFRGRAHWGKTTVPHADQKNDKNGHGPIVLQQPQAKIMVLQKKPISLQSKFLTTGEKEVLLTLRKE